MKRFPSHVAIDDAAKTLLIESMNAALASAIDLSLQVKQAHWNIKGPHFFARHELFDALAAHLREGADIVAERISALGGYANGTVRLSAERSQIEEYDLAAVDGRAHIRVLVDRYAAYAKRLWRTLLDCKENGDPVSEDIITQQLRSVERDMWFLESHVNV